MLLIDQWVWFFPFRHTGGWSELQIRYSAFDDLSSKVCFKCMRVFCVHVEIFYFFTFAFASKYQFLERLLTKIVCFVWIYSEDLQREVLVIFFVKLLLFLLKSPVVLSYRLSWWWEYSELFSVGYWYYFGNRSFSHLKFDTWSQIILFTTVLN